MRLAPAASTSTRRRRRCASFTSRPGWSPARERDAEVAKLYGEKGEISWGNQIRSYVMQPYQMVKDLRTEVETGNVAAVFDGDLDQFMEGYLRWRRAESATV